ncbi:Uncharacterised protein [Salmonella enterica subsp. enterica serovar Typhimurium str. DT104]|nr:Uncharacterised protein [Salmonella enterica subsp. enterica serovar Typhimurium str. DT104]
MAGHLFQRSHRIFRANDLHHLNFVKLMHTNQATGITTIRTCFRTETRRMRRHFNRQLIFVDDFIAYQIGQRNLRRRDQSIVAAVCFFFQRTGMEQVACEFRQLTGAIQRVVVNQIRHVVFAIAVLFRMQIQHELRQCAMHTRNLSFHHHKTGAGQLNRGGKVEAGVHFP